MSRSRLKIPEAYRALAAAARRSGWKITPLGSGHLRWQPPSGGFITTSASPSDRRAVANARAALRRAGLTMETP